LSTELHLLLLVLLLVLLRVLAPKSSGAGYGLLGVASSVL
jgi:hypothetical protein